MPDFPLHVSPHLWISITKFGGAGLTLPLALAIALWLAIGYPRKMALHWALALGTAIAFVTLTKIAFIGWGIGIRNLDFTGFSGHAMLASAVYPVAGFLVLIRARPIVRAAGITAGLAVSAAIGFSRIVLAAHSLSEVISGYALGALVALVFIGWWWSRAQPGRLPMIPVVLSLVALTFALHNVNVPTHRWVTRLSLIASGHDRPYVRVKWNAGGYDAHPVEPVSSP